MGTFRKEAAMRLIETRAIKGIVILVIMLLAAGCGGSAGSGGHSGAKADSLGLAILQGDGQSALIGQPAPVPLAVQVTNGKGSPLQNVKVVFSAPAGQGGVSAAEVLTDAEGVAETTFTAGAVVGPVSVTAAAGTDRAAISLQVRHPQLSELISGAVDGTSVVNLPVIAAFLPHESSPVLVLIQGQMVSMDLSQLPLAGELTGVMVAGFSAEELPAVMVEAEVLFGTPPNGYPLVSELINQTTPGGEISGRPAVRDLTVNGDTVTVVPCDYGVFPGGTGGVELLGEVASGGSAEPGNPGAVPPGEDFPLLCTDDAGVFGSTVSSYVDFGTDTYLPVFPDTLDLEGGWVSGAMPLILGPIAADTVGLVAVNEAVSELAAVLPPGALSVDRFIPRVSLRPLPPQYLPAALVIKNQIAPDIKAMGPVLEGIGKKIQAIITLVTQNQDVIKGLLNGNLQVGGASDLLKYMGLANLAMDLLRNLDDVAEMGMQLVDLVDQTLADIRAELLPAIAGALPADGIPFGGQSDGAPSTVRDNVIPYLDGQLAVTQDGLAVMDRILDDVEQLIPDNLNLFSLISLVSAFQGGAIDQLMNDVNGFAPVIQEGLSLTLTQGLPIASDLVDALEQDLQGDPTTLGQIVEVRQFVNYLETAVPAGTKVGGLPYAALIAPVLAEVLPPELGPVQDLDLLAVVVPYLENSQTEDVLIPLLREAIAKAELGLPQLISDLDGGLLNSLAGLGV